MRGKDSNLSLVENVARWIGNMLRVFGLGEGQQDEIGWGEERRDDGTAVANVGIPGPTDSSLRRQLITGYLTRCTER